MARIPLPTGNFLKLKTAVVPINFPFVNGLDVFINYSLQIHRKHNQLKDHENKWTLPLLYPNGQF